MADASVPRASKDAERLVRQMNIAYKAVKLYPATSAIPKESATECLAAIRAMLRMLPDVALTVTKEGLFMNGGMVFPEQDSYLEFAREFFNRHIAEVRFHHGVTVDELLELLRLLDTPPAELAESGGVEARLWEAGVVNISVSEASARIVESDAAEMEGAQPETDYKPETIDEALAAASLARPRDQLVLVRLVDSPQHLLDYLAEAARGRGTTPPSTWLTNRVSALAKAMIEIDPEEALPRIQAIADALDALDEETLRDALAEKMLTESKHDPALAEVVRRLNLERVCSVLAGGFEDTEASREGLTRAFRNLLQISDLAQEDVMGAVGAALDEREVPTEVASRIVGDLTPKRIVRESATRDARTAPVERVLRMLDLAPVALDLEGSDREELESEAALGIGDSEILGTLVDMITIEHRDEQFNSLMSIVEDGLSLLVMRGDYGVAAAVTDALVEAVEDPARPVHQRERMSRAIDAMASKANMRGITAAMRGLDSDSAEYKACRHLLYMLGRHAIAPLLEVLADEPDMASRKAIVSLLCEMAPEHINELGDRLADPRWYFVRNIVTILGSTRTPQTLQLLERTLRHSDARVRRETIRAVSGIRDALGVEMLVAALGDEDPHNVQLAARYLGLMGARTAVGALEAVAQGSGPGNRDTAARVEAIEALGRLRSAASIPVLKSLTRTRRVRGRGASKEISAAAQKALAVVTGASGGEVGVPAADTEGVIAKDRSPEGGEDVPPTTGEEAGDGR
ncbi:MAG: HEAT repeat domain-containing protein [Coriobacteriia bacterium]